MEGRGLMYRTVEVVEMVVVVVVEEVVDHVERKLSSASRFKERGP